MERFIIELLNRLGLGVNGNIKSLNTDKVKEMLPSYTFVKVKEEDGKTTYAVTENENGTTDFSIICTHNEKGFIRCITTCSVNTHMNSNLHSS